MAVNCQTWKMIMFWSQWPTNAQEYFQETQLIRKIDFLCGFVIYMIKWRCFRHTHKTSMYKPAKGYFYNRGFYK